MKVNLNQFDDGYDYLVVHRDEYESLQQIRKNCLNFISSIQSHVPMSYQLEDLFDAVNAYQDKGMFN